ncbi:MAG: amidohydrolase family protein [Armatimonadetes bacterium]|nr:amidohydrolase family protein [Armatimonadota bacterium]MDE2205994.1 amidohydrolase family protein [Armatimonadota bacterium]
MPTDLQLHIENMRVVDTHEHLHSEQRYLANPPDILQSIFDNYVVHDLVSAGAPRAAVDRLLDKSDTDIAARFEGVAAFWERCRLTGYGEAAASIAWQAYGVRQLTGAALAQAQSRLSTEARPGTRLRVLRDTARLHSVQIDDFCWKCEEDASGPGFFLYDLSWCDLACGQVDVVALEHETGIPVNDLASLEAAAEGLFSRYASAAVAVKTQHAYRRTLLWQPRERAEADAALGRILTGVAVAGDQLVLGDAMLARGAELAAQYKLPLKIHTGYYAGNGPMPMEWIEPQGLWQLVAEHPETDFVLMHTGWPYTEELVALVKHMPNAWADFCWAWSINPYRTRDVARSLLHSVPLNKVLGFGGDAWWPQASAAYARQARRELEGVLSLEQETGFITEKQATTIADRWLFQNAIDLFRLTP